MAKYYTNTRVPDSLFKDESGTHTSYSAVDSAWKPTEYILNYFKGQDNEMEPVTLEQAQKLQPEAFANAG